jgi:hypothetical protein
MRLLLASLGHVLVLDTLKLEGAAGNQRDRAVKSP